MFVLTLINFLFVSLLLLSTQSRQIITTKNGYREMSARVIPLQTAVLMRILMICYLIIQVKVTHQKITMTKNMKSRMYVPLYTITRSVVVSPFIITEFC